MVGVKVREIDLGQFREPDIRAQQLPLRPLGAINEQPVTAAAEECGRRGALCGWRRSSGTEKDEVEVHGRRF